MFENQVRESVVAGSFYPANPAVLKETISGYLEKAPVKNLENIIGLVCPHAGYIYSGQVAACSYRQIARHAFDCVAIIAPSHGEYFDFNSVFAGEAYQTPLGLVEVDTERCRALAKNRQYSNLIKVSNYGHGREHSLEVQLPFLQVVLDDFKIIPVVMGSQNRQNIEGLGNAIGETFKDENILIIASTDLSHYHPYDIAAGLDSVVQDCLKDFDADKFTDAISKDRLEMCGGGPVAASMMASKILGADSSEVLCYQNSGDVSGDRSAVVGYVSAAFFKS